MASRDYVKRGRGNSNQPKKRNQSKSRRKPWRSGLFALILLGVFGFGLFTLSQDPEPEESKPVVSQAKPKQKKTSSLPAPPEEKWGYVDSLPNREIEVTAKEQVVSKIPYIMQCGAYKRADQAESRKLDIAFQGLNSKIRKKEDSSWYRVVLGPYKFRRDAERDKHKLQRAKIEPCAIWKESQ